jgi:hypothetical protein
VLSALEIALAAAAFLIGLTGTWSPCGFSMVDTIGPTGHTGGRRTAVAAAATFAPGAVVGGIVTFGALAAIGGLIHGAGGTLAYLVAAAIAVVAAIAEARGSPIVPQIRRQLPEHWRRMLPMPVAAAGYGVLLGLGFTTFVLSFGVWALAGMSFAVGDLDAGLVVGAAFGVGRALPIAVLAPIADRSPGIRATELMAERPGIYRGARIGDALALLAAAAALTTAGTASAARPEAEPAADPSTEAGDLAWQLPDRSGVLRRAGQQTPRPLPGDHPAIGGPYAAVATGVSVRLLDRATLRPIVEIPAPGVDAVAVSAQWLVYRVRRDGRDVMLGRSIARPASPGEVIALSAASGSNQLGIPSLHGGLAAFAIAKQRANRIVTYALESGKGRTVVASHGAALSSASVAGDGRKTKLVYVRATRKRQRLMIKRVGRKGAGHAILSRRGRKPMMWSTTLSDDRAYVTLLSSGGARIVSTRR